MFKNTHVNPIGELGGALLLVVGEDGTVYYVTESEMISIAASFDQAVEKILLHRAYEGKKIPLPEGYVGPG